MFTMLAIFDAVLIGDYRHSSHYMSNLLNYLLLLHLTKTLLKLRFNLFLTPWLKPGACEKALVITVYALTDNHEDFF
jgi:hypothetical protein